MAEKCKEKRIKELLAAYGFDLLDDDQSIEVERHVLTCQGCSDELYRITELNQELRGRPQEHLGLLDQVSEKKKAHRFIPSFTIRLIAYVTTFLLVITGTWMYTHKRPPAFSVKDRTEIRGNLRLIEPKGNLSGSPRVFKWEGIEGAKTYVVEIKDMKTGQILFKMEKSETSLSLSESEVNRFQPGLVYAWVVKAFDPSGQIIAESEEEFSISYRPRG